jgi:hypothetical protein
MFRRPLLSKFFAPWRLGPLSEVSFKQRDKCKVTGRKVNGFRTRPAAHVRFGSKADIAPVKCDAALRPDIAGRHLDVVGCRILHNLLRNFRACPNAAPTAMAGYF